MPQPGDDPNVGPTTDPRRRKATFGQTLAAVLWSFFGVRKGSDHERDAAQLNPVHVIVVALVAVLIFVLVLILIVKSVVK